MYYFKLQKRIHFCLYNLIKKKIIRVNNVHFVKKCLHFVNLEEEIKVHKFSNKR